jgi:DNA-binding NarL/FixJ family response regulator
MPSFPRVITVDPSLSIARVIRAATDLLDSPIIQVDVPRGAEAIEEIKRGGAQLVITAFELEDEMKGIELALLIKQTRPDSAVVILADDEDPDLQDEETVDGVPRYIYLRRPIDIHQFLRILVAGLRGEDVFAATRQPAAERPAGAFNHGPLPPLNVQSARSIVQRLLADVGAMAILVATRTGEVLLEEGATGYLNREQLTKALAPTVASTIEMSDLVGGQPQAIHFYDGNDKDVFVLSVGLHHFLCIVFDGSAGSRQFGIVNRYGRQAVQDLIALLGASAFVLERPAAPAVEEVPKRKRKSQEAEKIAPVLERAEVKVPEPEPLHLDPIQNFDVSIFDQLGKLDASAADDLFDLDKLADMVNATSGRKTITEADAEELGIISNLGSE